MKLNNKGFAITAVLYGLLILFVVLVSSYLLVLSARKDRIDTLVNEIEGNYDFQNNNAKMSKYIVELYKQNTPTEIIHYKEDGTTIQSKYYYSYLDETKSWGLMNDGLGGTITDVSVLQDASQGNIRYFGKNPNNYIYFNCDDYSNQTESTCEKWRIIGVFDGKVKIIRNDILGVYPWNLTDAGTWNNNWHESTLNRMLNQGYYNNSKGYYVTQAIVEQYIDFGESKTGIKSNTQNLISNSTWYLGGKQVGTEYVDELYKSERGDNIGANTSKTWEGKIALMYPSDYGYAVDLSLCKKSLSLYYSCNTTNWLYNGKREWMLSPRPGSNYVLDTAVWCVYPSGQAGNYGVYYDDSSIRPVLYLNSKVAIDTVGNGNETSPYQLLIN